MCSWSVRPKMCTKCGHRHASVGGWSYGGQRDDKKKLHPCLVPYEELPEVEKLYDRNTAQQALKLILKPGFKIERA